MTVSRSVTRRMGRRKPAPRLAEHRWLMLTALLLLPWSPTRIAYADEIRVVSSPSLTAVINELTPAFQRATGHNLAVTYGLIVAQKSHVDAGDFDVALCPPEVIDYGIEKGKIRPDTRAEIARTGLGIGMRKGSAKPDVGSIEGFKRALLAARSVIFTVNEPSGVKIRDGFAHLGIAEQIAAKTRSADSIAGVWAAVASGDADFGFGFTANVLSAPGVELAGSFPAEMQQYTLIGAGIGAASTHVAAAAALISYLRGSDASAVLHSKGFESGAR